MKRVAVIGSPGAGKSTFTRKLGQKAGLPVIHLDSEHHKKDKDYYSNAQAWDAFVLSQIKREKWIIDGNFSSTFEARFARADTIIFLDTPRLLSMLRISRRLFHSSPEKRPEMPEGWKERFHYPFFRYTWRFRHKRRPLYFEMMKQQPEDTKVVVLKNKAQIEEFLKGIN